MPKARGVLLILKRYYYTSSRFGKAFEKLNSTESWQGSGKIGFSSTARGDKNSTCPVEPPAVSEPVRSRPATLLLSQDALTFPDNRSH